MFTITASDRHGIIYHGRIRRLTPRECLRLQGYRDEQIDKMEAVTSDNQLYKQAGNGVTVNVIEAIGKCLKEVDEEKRDITFGDATENYYDYGVPYEAPKVNKKYDYLDEKEEKVEKPEVKIVSSGEEIKDKPHKKEVPPVKSSINLLSTLKKSMGEEVQQEQPKQETKTNKSSKKDLELTDDLFNLIDSMYDERND